MKNLKLILIIIYSVFNIINFSNQLKPENVVIGINCGGDDYEGHDGIKYQADDFFNKGTPSDYGIQYEISQTKDEELYQTERWAEGDLIYSIPFDVEPGKYIAILKFSEVYFGTLNEKVFDIALGSKIVITDLDIFERVGKARAHDEFIEFEINNEGKLIFNVSFHILYVIY